MARERIGSSSPLDSWALDREIVLSRVIAAPRDLVFRAWTDPQHLPMWFGPEGFKVETHEIDDVTPIRRRYGVPDHLASCHTAVVGGYAIEGHVPASDIEWLLRERPKVRGLAVPGMVPGSPGMDQGPPQPYETLAFDDRGSRIFARH